MDPRSRYSLESTQPPECDICDACGSQTPDVEFLPCTHVVCVRCFEDAALANDSSTGCVICDSKPSLHHMTSHGGEHSDLSPPVCHLCGDAYAVSYCTDCAVNLCEFCEQAHFRQKRTANHNLILLENDPDLSDQILLQVTNNINKSLPECPHFNSAENGSFFCENCHKCICHNCKESDHFDHQTINMSDMDIHCFEKLQNLLSKTKPLISTLKDSVHTIEHLLHNIEEKTSQIGDTICHIIDTHISSLEEHRMALLAELGQIKKNKITILSRQLTSLTQALDNIHSTCDLTSQVLAPGNEHSNSLSVKLSLANQLEELTDVRYEYRPQADDYIHYLPLVFAGFRKGYEMKGVLDTQTPSPINSAISDEGLKTAKQRRPVSLTLIVFDKEGTRKLIGGDHVELRVQSSTGSDTKTNVLDGNDGSYELIFIPDSYGEHRVSVLLGGKHIKDSPLIVQVHPRKKHKGRFHCCSFCSTEGKMNFPCACGATMPGEAEKSGCGHSHNGHPGCWHWSCCGSTEESSDCLV